MNNKDKFYTYVVFLGSIAIAGLLWFGPPPDLIPNLRPAPSPVLAPVLPYVDAYQSYELIRAHNAERASHGYATLDPHIYLVAAARKHATFMATRGRMAHSGIGDGDPATRVTAEGYRWSGVAENVAWNSADIPATMRMWMLSPGHRANILGRYAHMGAAVAYSKSGQPYWCAVFGNPIK